MANIGLKVAAAVTAIGLAGCMTYKPIGSVLPQVDGTYRVVCTGANETDALRVAQEDAQGTCKDVGRKSFVVVNQKTDYIGPNLEASIRSDSGGAALKLLQMAAASEIKENYKVEMKILCK